VKASHECDWLILFVALVLCVIGVATLYSAGHPVRVSGAPVESVYLQRQLLWLAVGSVALLLGAVVPFRVYETLAQVMYAACVVLLVAVLLLPNRGETQRWIALGPVNIQPSELAKVGVLFVWARALSGHRGDPNRIRKLVHLLVLFAVPFLLVLRQPDLGTSLVFPGLLLAMMYWRGFRGIHIIFLLSPFVTSFLIVYGDMSHNPWPFGVFIVAVFAVAYVRRRRLLESVSLIVANLGIGLAVPVVWNDLKSYQQTRILNFLDPNVDRLGAGWQVIQSKIAIGSGGFGGKGYLAGTQKALEFLPAKHTDFVFSVLGEEMGFVGALVVLSLFAIIVYRALAVAQKCKSEFASTVCVGIAAYFFLQVAVNVAMTTGMAPVTGIPLPFVSYGGSSLLVSSFLIGFLLNASARWYEY